MTAELGVLLPVRIETRFKNGDLWLRVVPDEPWFVRDDPRITPAELGALQRYAATPLDTASGVPAAWSALAAAVGAARAVYLHRTFVTTAADGTRTVRTPTPAEQRDGPGAAAHRRLPGRARRVGGRRRRASPGADAARQPRPAARRLRRPGAAGRPALVGGLGRGRRGGRRRDHPGREPDRADRRAVRHRRWATATRQSSSPAWPPTAASACCNPGVPTNSVDGAPAAALATDPATWWAVLQGAAGDADVDVAAALTGDASSAGQPAGRRPDAAGAGVALVTALWAALWGFTASQVFDVARGGAPAEWAATALFPEGAYPIVRVGPQPYGLLPTTAWTLWQPDDGDPALEVPLVKALLVLRARHASSAEARGTAAGKDTDGLLDLIADTPSSGRFRYRQAWPLELWWLAAVSSGLPVTWRDFAHAWTTKYPLAEQLALGPLRRYGARGPSRARRPAARAAARRRRRRPARPARRPRRRRACPLRPRSPTRQRSRRACWAGTATACCCGLRSGRSSC